MAFKNALKRKLPKFSASQFIQLNTKPVKGIKTMAKIKPCSPYLAVPLKSIGVKLKNDKTPAKIRNGIAQNV